MKAIGSVVAISDSGITLYTDTLFWDAKKEKMTTLDSVMITTLEFDTFTVLVLNQTLILKIGIY